MNEDDYIDRLKAGNHRVVPYDGKVSEAGDNILISATLRTLDCEAHCAALTPAVQTSSRRARHREPTLVIGTHTVSQEQQLACRFVGYVQGQLQHTPPLTVTIVTMDGRSHKVPLDKNNPELDAAVETLRKWRLAPPAEPSPVILNKHCPLCPFRGACTATAKHDDDLSLLDRMTLKARQHYHDRGIFTVAQLSYLFKPRRRRKQSPKAPVHHQFELQALALRTGKTYLHELPALARPRTELFLDFEGVPDRHVQYLLGLLVCHEEAPVYHPFWADGNDNEAEIWRQLLAILDEYPDAPVYHYGQYEPRAIAALAKRYQTPADGLSKRLVNINVHVYGGVLPGPVQFAEGDWTPAWRFVAHANHIRIGQPGMAGSLGGDGRQPI